MQFQIQTFSRIAVSVLLASAAAHAGAASTVVLDSYPAGQDPYGWASQVFADGSAVDVDIVILATGYEPLQEAVRVMFGNDVAERVGPIWGIGPDGELRAMYAPTGQDGFFVAGGGFPAARAYSRYTALYIKAALEGMIPDRQPTPQNATDERSAWRAEDKRADNLSGVID